jgi:hypothetical protein
MIWIRDRIRIEIFAGIRTRKKPMRIRNTCSINCRNGCAVLNVYIGCVVYKGRNGWVLFALERPHDSAG